MELGAIHKKVVDMLSKMHEQDADERIMKMNQAHERIDGEYHMLVKKALRSMRVTKIPAIDNPRLAHLRRLLALFVRPGIKEAFLLYAKKAAARKTDRYGDDKKQPHPSLASEATTVIDNDVSNSEPSSRFPPLRRASSTRSSKDNQDDLRGTKWRVHGDSEGIDLTLTADSAGGRVPTAPTVGADEALKTSRGGSDATTSSTAVESAELMGAKARELDLKKCQGPYIHTYIHTYIYTYIHT